MNKGKTIPSDKRWLEDTFLATPDGIIVYDFSGTILEANPAFSAICRQPVAAIIGKKYVDLLCPSSKAHWTRNLEKLIKGEWSNIDDSCMFADGTKIPLEFKVLTKTVFQGKKAIVLHIRNVSIYHTVENALVASQTQWELSFNSINDEMWIIDRNFRVLRANQAALRKVTLFKSDPIGAVFADIYHARNPATGLEPLLSKIFQEPRIIPEIEFDQIKGTFSLASYPIKGTDGKATEAIVIIRDITEQCRQEALLKKIEIQRQKSHRIEALGRLAGAIAHDFNNILTTLLGYISLVLQSDNLGNNERTYLTEIMRTVERGTALTRQLFDFSTEKKSDLKPLNLNVVIQNIHKMLLQILGAGIAITTRLDQQLWNINGDVSRLERMLTNFATNARDAMSSGGEFIIETVNTVLDENFCRTHPELKPGNYVLLQVSDTGSGMPPEIMERIFEPFFTTKQKGKGIGLGLTSVFAIVRHFGGQIICYSEKDKGTTFKVYLPKSSGQSVEEKHGSAAGELPGGSETILIVDDEIHIVSMLTQILTKIGYKVLSATNSSKAIQFCKEYNGAIDTVLSDVIMPDMNGVELLSALRELRPQMKAVFMSGYTNSMAVESVGLEKNTVFLQKPFTFEELAKKIRLALDQRAN